jgi:hypothetical protein
LGKASSTRVRNCFFFSFRWDWKDALVGWWHLWAREDVSTVTRKRWLALKSLKQSRILGFCSVALAVSPQFGLWFLDFLTDMKVNYLTLNLFPLTCTLISLGITNQFLRRKVNF